MPEDVRGHYLARRAALSTITMVIVGLVVSRVVDWNGGFAVFTTVFAVASFFGMADIACFVGVREPPMPPREEQQRRSWFVMREPLRDVKFRRYLLYSFSESFMYGIAAPFFMVFALEYLRINNFWSTFYISTIPMLGTALTLPLWGRACDRFGYRPLLVFGTLVGMVYPLGWFFATPQCYLPFAIAIALIGGCLAPSVTAADNSMMYDLTPRENRSTYVAFLMLTASLGGFLAPLLVGLLAQAHKGVQVHVGGMTLTYLHFIMIVVILGEAVACDLRCPASSGGQSAADAGVDAVSGGWAVE